MNQDKPSGTRPLVGAVALIAGSVVIGGSFGLLPASLGWRLDAGMVLVTLGWTLACVIWGTR